MRRIRCAPAAQAHTTTVEWRRYAGDTLLVIAGVGLVTVVLTKTHLYPRLPSSALAYLLLIVALASTRGHYPAILAALLASLSLDSWLVSMSDSFTLGGLEELVDPLIFLGMAIATGQLAAMLRRHIEQARSREREARLLSEQAQEVASLRERQRLARELHDSVAQSLYGISLGAYTARDALASNPEEVIASLEYVIALAEAGMADMRALIFELLPDSLAAEGVVAALDKQVAVLRTHYRLAVDAQLCEEPSISLERKQALYRIAQEALHNVVKHARARAVLLRLSRQDGDLMLEVRDDGQGFSPTEVLPGHLGIRSIQERAAWLGGACSIESASLQGTCLRVRVPAHDVPGIGHGRARVAVEN